MKLGEALSLRAAQAGLLGDLRVRISRNALTQEGEEPTEDVDELLEAHRELSEEHRSLVKRIHAANSASGLLELLMEREHLRRLRAAHEEAIKAAAGGGGGLFRYSRNEIKMLPTVVVADEIKKRDDLNEKIRVLDAQIQAQNWTIEI